MKLEVSAKFNGRAYDSAGMAIKDLRERSAARIKALQDFGNPLAQIAVLLDRWVKKNFASEGGSVGGWKPFQYGGRVMPDGTIDTSAKLLQDTGRLRASFLPFHSDKIAGIGTDLPYAEPHNKIRRMLPVREEVIEQVKRIFQFHAKESASK